MYLLDNPTRCYDWGSRTVIADLLGRGESEKPQAELWIGAHPESPSGIVDAGTDLLARLRADPLGMLGPRAYATFGDRLPYLLKVLAVERPLSLQVHPDGRNAVAGFDAESDEPRSGRVFKDPHHKPELLYAISEFRALCGFRPVEEARDVFEALAQRAPRVRTFAQIVRLLADSDHDAALRTTCAYLARLGPDEIAAAAESIPGAAVGDTDASLQVAARVATAYPKDVAVLLTVLLRHVVLAAGDTLGVEPGTPHTYLRGAAVELTTCSDNTIRAGLTHKPTDIERFIDVLDVGSPTVTSMRSEQRNAAERSVTTDHAEFELSVLRIAPGMTVRWGPKPRTVLVLDGRLTLTDETGSMRLRRGESVFVPADSGAVEVGGDGQAVQATTGV
ncbi:MAG: mannose-6-phosphate isomerase, class I [Nocardioidaceae bacterium]